jgi:hypothetical protein
LFSCEQQIEVRKKTCVELQERRATQNRQGLFALIVCMHAKHDGRAVPLKNPETATRRWAYNRRMLSQKNLLQMLLLMATEDF